MGKKVEGRRISYERSPGALVWFHRVGMISEKGLSLIRVEQLTTLCVAPIPDGGSWNSDDPTVFLTFCQFSNRLSFCNWETFSLLQVSCYLQTQQLTNEILYTLL